MSTEELIKDLHRRATVTSRCKFNASHRLHYHHHLSQWTIALISVILITLPLIQLSNIFKGFDQNLFFAIQIVFAVLILVYSLLLSMNNFKLRSIKMHQCGVELTELSFETSHTDGNNYKELYTKYCCILDKYENHRDTDYLLTKLSMRDYYYKDDNKGVIVDYLRSRYLLVAEFVLYYSIIPSFIIICMGLFLSYSNI